MCEYREILKMWKKLIGKEDVELEEYLHSFKIPFMYHSEKISNQEKMNTKEILKQVYQEMDSNENLIEQQNQKICCEWMFSNLKKRTPISVSFIKEGYNLLYQGISENKDIDSIEAELNELVLEINELDHITKEKQALTIATYFYVRFEELLPFTRVNEQLGRILLNYYLILHNHPPIIIFLEDIYFHDACLQKYDEMEELAPLEEFFRYQVEKTWQGKLHFQ